MLLTDRMGVVLIDSMGDDRTVVAAARVSTVGAAAATESYEQEGLLRFLMRNKHASPFEHVVATFLVDVPLFVRSEWQRHRTQSYNETSGRYSELEPKFYMPGPSRPVCQMGKPGAYRFAHGVKEQQERVALSLESCYATTWRQYQQMLEAGVAKEVARMVLPVGTYTQFYATANLRNWMNFLALRTDESALCEIRQAAAQVEQALHAVAPISMALWNEYERGSL